MENIPFSDAIEGLVFYSDFSPDNRVSNFCLGIKSVLEELAERGSRYVQEKEMAICSNCFYYSALHSLELLARSENPIIKETYSDPNVYIWLQTLIPKIAGFISDEQHPDFAKEVEVLYALTKNHYNSPPSLADSF